MPHLYLWPTLAISTVDASLSSTPHWLFIQYHSKHFDSVNSLSISSHLVSQNHPWRRSSYSRLTEAEADTVKLNELLGASWSTEETKAATRANWVQGLNHDVPEGNLSLKDAAFQSLKVQRCWLSDPLTTELMLFPWLFFLLLVAHRLLFSVASSWKLWTWCPPGEANTFQPASD